MHTRISCAIVLAAGGCLLAGCSIHVHDDTAREPAYRWVSPTEFSGVVAANRGLTLGMSKAEALRGFAPELTTLRSTARAEGLDVEEWLVYAVEDHGRARFERWLYFGNGRLVEVSDDRIDYRDDDAACVKGWSSIASGS